MSLEEIEAFRRSLNSNCPKCNSREGFWLTANNQKSYVQCKHCGAILEFLETFSQTEKDKESKSYFRKLKL